MESPIKFDLSRVSYPAFLQIILPFLPGGLFVCGALVLNLAGVRALISTIALSTPAKVVLLLFAAYVAGLVLHLSTNALTYTVMYFLGYLLGHFWSKMWTSDEWEPWRSHVWRKVARAYLGPLAPATDDLYFKDNHVEALRRVDAIQDPDVKRSEANFCLQYFSPLLQADIEWSSWYWVLRERFPQYYRIDATQHSYSALLSVMYSVGWTGVILLAFAPGAHWLLWTAAVASVLTGTIGDVGRQWSESNSQRDPFANRLTAEILRYLQERSAKAPDRPSNYSQ